MAQVINEKHLWLLGQFWNGARKESSSNSLQEIRERFYKDFGFELKDRTFHQHKKTLNEALGVEITCNNLNMYSIANMDEIRLNPILQWTIDSLSVQNLVKNASEIKNHLFLEELPGGTIYLDSITKAIKLKYKIKITYQAFIKRDIQEDLIVWPYALKTYRRRWYLLAKAENNSKLRHFALDRIQKLGFVPKPRKAEEKKEMFETFAMPKASDLRKYYCHAVGIWVTDNQEAEIVVIRAYGKQGDYLRTLPLHPSQKEEVSTPEYTEFSYYILVNPDLEHEILARAEELEVVKPESLRKAIKERIAKMAARY